MLKFTKIIFTFTLFILSIHETQAMINKPELDQRIQEYIKDKPVKSIIYGLWIDGKPVSVNALGLSMTDVPSLIQMHYRIGGITETMLTATMVKMIEEDKIKIDEPISRWYPNLPNAKDVTLRMLANCTSGYPDYVYNPKFVAATLKNPFKSWSDQELIHYAMMDKPQFKPGTSQHYTHTDYVLLGHILTEVSQLSMNELLNQYIFKKLNLTQTRFDQSPTLPEPALHAFSQDRTIYEDATYWSPSWTSSSGSINSTITDLGIWANAWMHPGFLDQKAIKMLRAPDTVGLGKNTKDLYFAMGFAYANHWLIQNPSFGGYSGVYAVLPEKNLVFIAVNTLQETHSEIPNLSFQLWESLVTELAPEYPVQLPS